MRTGYLSALAEPLRIPIFRWLWIATVFSNVGTLMHSVGAAWLMTSMTTSPFLVGLVPASVFLPTFLVGLWGGVLADLFERRKVLIFTQGAMMITALLQGVLTLAGVMNPALLISLTFLLGLASSLNLPAWQSQIQDIVPRPQVAAAVSLNSMSFNTARSIGPAIGGVFVGLFGPSVVFLLNSASYLGTVFVLVRWKPAAVRRPQTPFWPAMREGVRYVLAAPEMKAPLLRVSVFCFGASAIWAIMPLLARETLRLGPGGYGTLLSAFGLGSLTVGSLVPGLRRFVHPDRIVGAASLILAIALWCVATIPSYSLILLVLFAGGFAWVGAMVQFNVAVQTSVPAPLRGRAMSFYIVCFQGSMGIGSAFHGWLAGKVGIPHVLTIAGVVVVAGVVLAKAFPFRSSEKSSWVDPDEAP